jgi:hypothetical protein
LEECREALRAQPAQRGIEERWMRSWPFLLVLSGCGLRPLKARRLEIALRRLSVDEPSGPPLTRREECLRLVLLSDCLIRLIVSYL